MDGWMDGLDGGMDDQKERKKDRDLGTGRNLHAAWISGKKHTNI